MMPSHWKTTKQLSTRYFCFCNDARNLDVLVEADSDEEAVAVADTLVPVYGPYARRGA
jgi:hypothetical protein